MVIENGWKPPKGFRTTGGNLTPWRPNVGEVLHGIYKGSVERGGKKTGLLRRSKTYLQHLIEDEQGTIYGLTGTNLDRQFDGCEIDTECYVEYVGNKDIGGGRSMKEYNLYLPDPEHIAQVKDDLPI